MLQYCSVTASKKPSVPGNFYFKNLFKFVDLHEEFGELYMKYRKGKCEAGGLFCDYCTKTPTIIQGPVLPVPRLFPDPSRLPNHHYKNCSETHVTEAAGNYRQPDDFQRRFQLRSLFSSGLTSSDDKAAINNWSTKFVVSEKLVMDYLSHLEKLKLRKEKINEYRKKI